MHKGRMISSSSSSDHMHLAIISFSMSILIAWMNVPSFPIQHMILIYLLSRHKDPSPSARTFYYYYETPKMLCGAAKLTWLYEVHAGGYTTILPPHWKFLDFRHIDIHQSKEASKHESSMVPWSLIKMVADDDDDPLFLKIYIVHSAWFAFMRFVQMASPSPSPSKSQSMNQSIWHRIESFWSGKWKVGFFKSILVVVVVVLLPSCCQFLLFVSSIYLDFPLIN